MTNEVAERNKKKTQWEPPPTKSFNYNVMEKVATSHQNHTFTSYFGEESDAQALLQSYRDLLVLRITQQPHRILIQNVTTSFVSESYYYLRLKLGSGGREDSEP